MPRPSRQPKPCVDRPALHLRKARRPAAPDDRGPMPISCGRGYSSPTFIGRHRTSAIEGHAASARARRGARVNDAPVTMRRLPDR